MPLVRGAPVARRGIPGRPAHAVTVVAGDSPQPVHALPDLRALRVVPGAVDVLAAALNLAAQARRDDTMVELAGPPAATTSQISVWLERTQASTTRSGAAPGRTRS